MDDLPEKVKQFWLQYLSVEYRLELAKKRVLALLLTLFAKMKQI
jgi:hypothetical protein